MTKPVTPFMAQYLEIKSRNPETLLFFRMGDFYELFFEDAELAAEALDITLTHRGQHKGDPIPMAGVPYHSAEPYLARLIRSGHRVAVCEQTETPDEAKKRGSKSIVNRDIVRIVTPGTLTEDTLLDARTGNYLAALVKTDEDGAAFALADISTGRFVVASCNPEDVVAALSGFHPSELVVSEDLLTDPDIKAGQNAGRYILTTHTTRLASAKGGKEALVSAFDLSSAEGLGAFSAAEFSAMGLILSYIELTQAGIPPQLDFPARTTSLAGLVLDETTRQALEIERTQTGSRKGSLLHAIDRTRTAAGARLLAECLSRPLADIDAINARLDSIQAMLDRDDLRASLRDVLKGLPDLDRIRSRLRLGRANPVDVRQVHAGLSVAVNVANLICSSDVPEDGDIKRHADTILLALNEGLTELADHIDQTLKDEPPSVLSDGGFVRKGASAELDQFRTLKDDSRKVISGLEARYQTETGVSALRIRFNAMLGYFVEIPAKHVDAFEASPLYPQFHRRQGLANATRYVTEEVSDLARQIDSAESSAKTLELQIFAELVEHALQHSERLRRCAVSLASIDLACAGAEWADEISACRPGLFADARLSIEAGRHPVVEAALRKDGKGFVSNSLNLGTETSGAGRLQIITGPNMAGKSTFLRQTALLVILAQSGWYVPARQMDLGIVDRVYSRVGASDDLAKGKSTFMVEMLETASILNQATDKSLVILDEVGRGTSTYDGLAIAWSCVEYLHDVIRCRGLFATHYHELTGLASQLPFAGNLSLKAREWRGDLIFLHEVQEGPADKSYGVQVARLAGLPKFAVQRAKQVLEKLESEKSTDRTPDDLPLFGFSEPVGTAPGSSVDDTPATDSDELSKALSELDPDQMSPREALDAIYLLKGLIHPKDI